MSLLLQKSATIIWIFGVHALTTACNQSKKAVTLDGGKKGSAEQTSSENSESSWTDEQRLKEQTTCIQGQQTLPPLEAASICNCFVKALERKWPYSEFEGNRTAYVKKMVDDGMLEKCKNPDTADNGVTQNTAFATSKWTTPQLMESDDVGKAWKTRVAISSGDRIAAAWSQHDGTKFNVTARVLANNQWTEPEMIGAGQAAEAANIFQEPKVAFFKENAMVVWTMGINQIWQVNANIFDSATQSWTGHVVMTSHTAGNTYGLDLEANKNGVGHIIWYLETDDNGAVMQGRSYDNGTWGNLLTFGTGSGFNTVQGSDVKVKSNGDAIAVWAQDDASEAAGTGMKPHYIWMNRYTHANKQWESTPQKAQECNGVSCLQPSIELLSNGRAVMTWIHVNDKDSQVWAKMETANGWGAPELLSGADIKDATAPRIGVDQYDNIHVTWYRRDDGGIYSRYYINNIGWQKDIVKIGTGTSTNKGWFPEMTVHPSGMAITTWAQWDGTRYNAWTNRFDGKTWGTPEMLPRAGTGGDITFPFMVINSQFKSFGVYYQDDGDRPDVWSIWAN